MIYIFKYSCNSFRIYRLSLVLITLKIVNFQFIRSYRTFVLLSKFDKLIIFWSKFDLILCIYSVNVLDILITYLLTSLYKILYHLYRKTFDNSKQRVENINYNWSQSLYNISIFYKICCINFLIIKVCNFVKYYTYFSERFWFWFISCSIYFIHISKWRKLYINFELFTKDLMIYIK